MEESPTDWETDNEEEENELLPKNNGTSVVSELFQAYEVTSNSNTHLQTV